GEIVRGILPAVGYEQISGVCEQGIRGCNLARSGKNRCSNVKRQLAWILAQFSSDVCRGVVGKLDGLSVARGERSVESRRDVRSPRSAVLGDCRRRRRNF